MILTIATLLLVSSTVIDADSILNNAAEEFSYDQPEDFVAGQVPYDARSEDFIEAAATEQFSYDAQDKWGGVCVSGNKGRQSPINIVTSAVQTSAAVPPLVFSGWSTSINGEFTNNGHSVQFDPQTKLAKTTTAYGIYTVQQLHMHWGRYTGEGSEHTIDGQASELEIHFVHTKEDTQQSGPTYVVIGVLASASSIGMSGPYGNNWTPVVS